MIRFYWKILLLVVFCGTTSYCQQPDDVSFLIDKLKQEYVGFSFKTNNSSFDKYVKKVIKGNQADTFAILSQLMDFFNDNHLQLYELNVFRTHPPDTSTLSQNIKSIRKILSERSNDWREGYWLNETNTSVIAIKKYKSGYEAFLIESKNKENLIGTRIAEMTPTNGKAFRTIWRVPSTGTLFTIKSEFRKDSTLITGDLSKWKKLKSYTSLLLPGLIPRHKEVFGEQLNNNTYLFTLPSFDAENIDIIDSIVKKDYNKICSSRNLILDIRNNTGGKVRVYDALFPFVYTNPIIRVGGLTICSDKLIQHKKDVLLEIQNSKKPDNILINEAKKDLELATLNRGKVLVETGDSLILKHVLSKPVNVAIIANYACQSAAEMMILDFKQSSKVTLFGEHTMGTIDYLNTYSIELPSGKYLMYMPTVKRYIPPGSTELEGKGIYPDIPISNETKDWVKFVERYYNSRLHNNGFSE